MKTNFFVGLALLTFSGYVSAQCTPGFPSCVPPEVAYGSQGLDAYGRSFPQPSAQPPVRVKWEDRWGAITVDASTGKVGAVAGQDSKSSAITAAISQCQGRGGRVGCEDIMLTYHNQCAALAWGGGTSIAHGAKTLDLASELALQECREKGANDCRIFYAECSMSELVQQ
jgi:Domain of unknown function (DUF4189)